MVGFGDSDALAFTSVAAITRAAIKLFMTISGPRLGVRKLPAPLKGQARPSSASLGITGQRTLITTSMLLRVALEYGQVWCAACVSASASARDRPGKLTFRRALRKY